MLSTLTSIHSKDSLGMWESKKNISWGRVTVKESGERKVILLQNIGNTEMIIKMLLISQTSKLVNKNHKTNFTRVLSYC